MTEEEKRCRAELADAIRANTDEIAARLERSYVEQYPQSRANQADAAFIHKWTLSEIGILANAIETCDMESLRFELRVGDQLVDAHNVDLTPFVNFLSCIYFEARVIAPVIYASSLDDQVRANRLLSCLEGFIQEVVVWNCQRYVDQVSQPHALVRTWNLMSAVDPSASTIDTPAKRYLAEKGNVASSTLDIGATSLEALSPREREVLQLVVAGKSNGEIAAELDIRQNTVKNHVAHIFDKFNVNSRVELVSLMLSHRSEDESVD